MNDLEKFCRGCLVGFEDLADLLQYTEKNRRLFHYSTALQVKKKDILSFQLCKDCYVTMKVACKFKKQCRTSDKQLKSYLALKAEGEDIDFSSFLKDANSWVPFRSPITGNGTPANRTKDDDNESTGTSIRNFMWDMLQDQEIPGTEAQIISEVLEEQADSDESIDSHWLKDDVSIDDNFRLDLSAFSTPKPVGSERYSPDNIDTPQKTFYVDYDMLKAKQKANSIATDLPIQYQENDARSVNSDKDSICRRLDRVLQNENVTEMPLENILASPKVPVVFAPLTPTINNILFGENIDIDEKSNSNLPKPGTEIETYHNVSGNMDIIEELFNLDATNNDNHDENNYQNLEFENNMADTKNIKNVEKQKTVAEDVKYDLKINKCYTCDKKLGDFDKMKLHLKNYHKITVEFKVPDSVQPIPDKSRQCNYCGEKFEKPRLFNNHLKKHKPPKRFGCPHCKLQFLSRMTLKIHMASHATSKPANHKTRYFCKICQLETMSIPELYKHQATHKESFTCDQCSKTFYIKTGLIVHMRLHEKPLKCSVCNKTFIHNRYLQNHMKIHENVQDLFVCDVCPKKFYDKILLRKHISRSKKCRKKRNAPFAEKIQQTKDELAEFIKIG